MPAERLPANGLYLSAVFGHDATSLRSAITPDMQHLPFDLLWRNDEDVIVTLSSTLPANQLENKIRTIRSVLAKQGELQANSIELCHVDADNNVSWRDEWKKAARSGTATPRWGAEKATSISSGNAFESLGPMPSPSTTPAAAEQSRTTFSVLGGGLNRPPTAVVMPDGGVDRSQVVDNWEDAA